VNFGKGDNEPAGHVLYLVDFVAIRHCEEEQAFKLRNKFRLSNLAGCS
jgi:hypothetical protein